MTVALAMLRSPGVLGRPACLPTWLDKSSTEGCASTSGRRIGSARWRQGDAVEREDLLIRTFVELADNLVVEFDVVDVLTTLAGRGVELLGVDAAGILLSHDGGKLRLVAASSEDGPVLELFELQSERRARLRVLRLGRASVDPRPLAQPVARARHRGGGPRPALGRSAADAPPRHLHRRVQPAGRHAAPPRPRRRGGGAGPGGCGDDQRPAVPRPPGRSGADGEPPPGPHEPDHHRAGQGCAR